MSDRRLTNRWVSRRCLGLLLWFCALLLSGPVQAGEAFISLGLARELAAELEDEVGQLTSEMRERSRGRMGIELVAVDPGRELLQAARAGKLDMVILPSAEVTAISPEFAVIELPFLFAGRSHAAKVLDGRIGKELLARLERVRLRGLAFWDIAEVHMGSREGPIYDTEALRGVRLGIGTHGEYLPAVLRELGAEVIPVPTGERYPALASGVINATETSIKGFRNRRYYEVQNSLALTRHRYVAAVVAFNWGNFEALEPDVRLLLEETSLEFGDRLRARHAREDQDMSVELRERGIEIIEDPNMDFAHELAWKLVYWEYAKSSAFDVLDAIERMR